MRKTVSAVLAVLLILLLISGAAAQERGFETPEACAKALFEALKTQDVEAMENCIAFDELAASYDFQAQAERLNALVPNMLLPAHSAFAVAANAANLRHTWYRKLESLNLSLMSPALETVYMEYRSVYGKDEAFAEALDALELMAGFNVYALLQYDGILTPDQIPKVRDVYYSEKNQEIIQKNLVVAGMDTYADIAITFTVVADAMFTSDAQYIIPLRLYEINGRWLADPGMSVIGNLLGASANSLLAEMPEE